MSRSETEYLRHIQDKAQYLTKASRNMSSDKFSDDETLKRALAACVGSFAAELDSNVTAR